MVLNTDTQRLVLCVAQAPCIRAMVKTVKFCHSSPKTHKNSQIQSQFCYCALSWKWINVNWTSEPCYFCLEQLHLQSIKLVNLYCSCHLKLCSSSRCLLFSLVMIGDWWVIFPSVYACLDILELSYLNCLISLLQVIFSLISHHSVGISIKHLSIVTWPS